MVTEQAAVMQETTAEQVRRDSLTWACKKSNIEINARIDELLTAILLETTLPEVREISKLAASELAKIIKRRQS